MPGGYWDDVSNQRGFMEDIRKQLNITTQEDWYKSASSKTIIKYGGAQLLKKYGNSVSKLMTTVYPEYPTVISRSSIQI